MVGVGVAVVVAVAVVGGVWVGVTVAVGDENWEEIAVAYYAVCMAWRSA